MRKLLVVLGFSILFGFAGHLNISYAGTSCGLPGDISVDATYYGLPSNYNCYGMIKFYAGNWGSGPLDSWCENSSGGALFMSSGNCFGAVINNQYILGWSGGPGILSEVYPYGVGGRNSVMWYVIFGPPPVQNLYDYHTGTFCGTISNGSTNPSAIQSWNYSNPNCFSSSPP